VEEGAVDGVELDEHDGRARVGGVDVGDAASSSPTGAMAVVRVETLPVSGTGVSSMRTPCGSRRWSWRGGIDSEVEPSVWVTSQAPKEAGASSTWRKGSFSSMRLLSTGSGWSSVARKTRRAVPCWGTWAKQEEPIGGNRVWIVLELEAAAGSEAAGAAAAEGLTSGARSAADGRGAADRVLAIRAEGGSCAAGE
jgi:hypothetical protein